MNAEEQAKQFVALLEQLIESRAFSTARSEARDALINFLLKKRSDESSKEGH